ncbi:hypothetical protein [Polyangium spumosum]|uniref:Uncharacterized protein n=1 Tax=Polyangium spumosum TaxID=889282 RepID=A0A6N7PPT5_9BACT|nr:hypothetical protein [Polyangium spumosum]MRG94003.1 hypothetical protein [Polyangium spumosum]
MTITRAELFDIVYRFYPRGVHNFSRIHVPPGEPVYDDTEEHRRLVEASNRGRAEYPTWEAMIDRLGDRYGLQNESINLLAGWLSPAYSARIYRPKDLEPVPSLSSRASLSFHVSLLGPYYGIHDMGGPDEKPAVVAAEIEATYPGYQTIPPELGNELVPDVAMDGALMGEATIYICLFSKVWTWVEP